MGTCNMGKVGGLELGSSQNQGHLSQYVTQAQYVSLNTLSLQAYVKHQHVVKSDKNLHCGA